MAFGFGARANQRQREDALRQALRIHGHQLRRVLERAVPRETAAGEVIVHRGDPADALFVIVTGKFEVSVASADGTRRVLRMLGAGTVFGEIAVLDDTARNADVISRIEGELLVLSATDARYALDGVKAARDELTAQAIERKAQLARSIGR
jgi:CRP-like cAMP-binding protein